MINEIYERLNEQEEEDTLEKSTVLTNKDKQLIRQLLFSQIETALLHIGDESSGWYADFKHLNREDVAQFLYRLVGLYPK